MKTYILFLPSLCPPPDTQHGTEWASSVCSLCSCTHGEVRCRPQPCPPLLCGYQELEFIPEGSCCPICVGRGSKYELVKIDPLCLWGSPGDIPRLLFHVQCGSKILNPISYWNKMEPCTWQEGMLQRVRLEQIFKLHPKRRILHVFDLSILPWPDASLCLHSFWEGKERGTRSFDVIP